MKEKWYLIALPLLTLSCFADASVNNPQMQNFNDRLILLEQQQRVARSASPEAEHGAHLMAFGELLVWQAHENGIPIAIKTANPTAGGPPAIPLNLLKHGAVKNIEYNWNAGFRFGVGYDWTRDKIDVSLTWLRFFTHGRRFIHAGSGEQLYPVQLHPLDGTGQATGQVSTPTMAFTKASAHWYAHLNQLDLDLGRAFFVGKWFNIRPHFGVRNTWIQQRLSVDYDKNLYTGSDGVTFGDDYDARRKSRWWGIGPAAGLEMSLGLGQGFSLCGDLAAAIEYGFHSVSRKELDVTVANKGLDPSLVDVRDNYRQSRPILDVQLGLKWEYMFKGNRCHLGLEGGWEQHVYYSQHQSPYFVDDVSIGSFIGHHGDLTFQGWSAALRLDY